MVIVVVSAVGVPVEVEVVVSEDVGEDCSMVVVPVAVFSIVVYVGVPLGASGPVPA